MSQGSQLLKILSQKSHSQYVPCMNVEKSSSTCWHFGNKRIRSNAKGTTCTESSGRLHGGNIILVWWVRDGGGYPLEDKAKLLIWKTGIRSSLTLPLSCRIYFRKIYLHFLLFFHTGMVQVVEIFKLGRQEFFCMVNAMDGYVLGTDSWIPSFDELVQDCSNSIADALELLQSCTKPPLCGRQRSIYSVQSIEW